MKLTEHFTLEELTASATAVARGIDNTPPPEIVAELRTTAEMMERIRSTLGVPLHPSSGFRCLPLNRAIGSSDSSDHPKGKAVDFTAPAFGTPTQIAKVLAPLVGVLGIGQLILEGIRGKQWVHVSTRRPDNPINRVITITDSGTVPGIMELRA